jgi:TolA-binding protein
VQRAAVASTLRFVEKFPQHEHAAAVLGAAVDDLYEMKEFPRAIATGRQLIDGYPDADAAIRRSAWTVVAHSSFETADYPQSEAAYGHVLEMTTADDAARKGSVDNLAASIYKQGELANAAQDYRAAADHFLRVAKAAPTSSIRPSAEYDAGAALIKLSDWSRAASVLDGLPKAYPEHQLNREATKQIAFVKREGGDPRGRSQRVRARRQGIGSTRAAPRGAARGRRTVREVEGERARARRLPRLRRAVPEAGRARRLETRWKIAGMYQSAHDEAAYRAQLREIVESDAARRPAHATASRYLAAQSALVLAQDLYRSFAAWRLAAVRAQPRGEAGAHEQRRSTAFGALVDYEVADVTAAATFYMAGDLRRLQPRCSSRSARRPLARRARGVRRDARGRGVPVRGEGDRGAREEPRAARARA